MGLMLLANVPAFYYGTSPNKFFDFISSGLPILNNYPGWLAGMIEENNAGVVIEPDNPEVFAEALIQLSQDPNLDAMGKNSRKLAETKFNRSELAEDFCDLLERV